MKVYYKNDYRRITFIFFLITILMAAIYLIMGSNRVGSTNLDMIKSLSFSAVLYFLPLLIYEGKAKLFKKDKINEIFSFPIFSFIIFVGFILIGFITRLLTINISFLIILLGIFLVGLYIFKFFKNVYQEIKWDDYIVIFLFAFALSFVVFGDYYQSPLYYERLVLGVQHKDNLWHAGISNIIRTYFIPSTGFDGLPFMRYHWGSHWIFAYWSELLDLKSIVFYNLTYSVLVIPFFVYQIIIFILEYLKFKGNNYSLKFIVFLIPLIFLVGIVPEKYQDYKEVLHKPLRSESFIMSLTYSFLVLSVVFSNIRKELKANKFTLYFLIPSAFIFIGIMKISVSYVLFGVFSYIFLRKKLFNIKYYIISYVLSLVSFSAILVFRLNFDFNTFVKLILIFVFLALAFFIYQKYLLKYKKIIFILIGICLGIFIFLINPLLLNIKNYYFSDLVKMNKLLYLAFKYFWVVLATILIFNKLKIRTLKDFIEGLVSNKLLEFEILLAVILVGILPSVVNKLGYNVSYFSNLQMWVGFVFVVIYSALDDKKKVWDKIIEKRIIIVFAVTVFFIFIFYNVYNNSLNNYTSAIKVKKVLEKRYSSAIINSDDSTGKDEKGYFENIFIQLSNLDNIPVEYKYSSCLYIPKTNELFWKLPARENFSIPSIFTSLTGLTLINGFPDNVPSNYGYYYYKKPYLFNFKLSDEILNQEALKKGFSNIIILKPNFHIEFRNLDNSNTIPDDIKNEYINKFKKLFLKYGYYISDNILQFKQNNKSVYFELDKTEISNCIVSKVQYCTKFPEWEDIGFSLFESDKSNKLKIILNENLGNGSYEVRLQLTNTNTNEINWIGNKYIINIPDYSADSTNNFELKPVYTHGYGQGIEVTYDPPSKAAKIDVQYRLIGELKWKNAAKKRTCLYDNYKFYGKLQINEEKHHLLPGTYEVKLRYHLITGVTDWIGEKIEVPPVIKKDEINYLFDTTFVLEPFYNSSYGWGIKCYFKSPEESTLDLEFKEVNDYSWTVYFKNRKRIEVSEIHTREIYDNIMGNMPPGKYEVRYRYKIEDTISNWIGNTITLDSTIY